MTTLVLISVLSLFPGKDPWWGKDKVQHLAVSFALHSLLYSYLRDHIPPDRARLYAFGLTLGVGVGKEVWDLRRTGFSLRDLWYDLAGAAASAAFP